MQRLLNLQEERIVHQQSVTWRETRLPAFACDGPAQPRGRGSNVHQRIVPPPLEAPAGATTVMGSRWQQRGLTGSLLLFPNQRTSWLLDPTPGVTRPASRRRGRLKGGEQERTVRFWAAKHSEVATGRCCRWKERRSRRVSRNWEQVETSVRETAWRREPSTGFVIGIDFTGKVFSYDCSRCRNKPLQLDQGLERLYREEDKNQESHFMPDPLESGSAGPQALTHLSSSELCFIQGQRTCS